MTEGSQEFSDILVDRFFARGREFLGVRYPFLCGAMTWISDPELVAAVCNAGAFASLAGGNAPPEIVEGYVRRTRELTDRPFGLNLVTIAPAFRAQLALLPKLNLDFVIFAGGFPRADEVRLAKDTGARVLCFASTQSIAERMLRYGADGIILEGMEAGGHVGHVSLTVLLQQVLFMLDPAVPVFVAGGIATGRMCAHMFLMGAAGVQLGTVFAASVESRAHPEFKKRFLRANARDAVSTPQFDSRLPVVAVRALRNRGLDDFGRLQLDLIRKLDAGEVHRAEAQQRVEEFWMGALRRAVEEGDTDHGSLMAGQSVGLVDAIKPVGELIAELVEGTRAELARTARRLCQ